MQEPPGPLAALWGADYPSGYVVAILPDDDTARQASEALAAAGVAGADVRVHPGQAVVERHAQFLQDRGRAERLMAAIHADERDALDEYVEEAREGSAFVTVDAAREGQVERAHAVLAELGAYGVRHHDRAGLHDLD